MAAFQLSHSPNTDGRRYLLFKSVLVGIELFIGVIRTEEFSQLRKHQVLNHNKCLPNGSSLADFYYYFLLHNFLVTSHLNFRADGLWNCCESLVGTVSKLLTPGPLTGTQVGTFPQEITPEMIIV